MSSQKIGGNSAGFCADSGLDRSECAESGIAGVEGVNVLTGK
jgi:hypothetical protein